jgi:hypothetical protein
VHNTSVSAETLWNEFAYEHATVPVLVRRHNVSASTVPRRLDEYTLPTVSPTPRTMVAIMDATRVGYSWILAVRDPEERETVYAQEISVESTSSYQHARAQLEHQGFSFSAIVSDGRFVAVAWLFPGIPVQMCHYHQEQIIIRYLTLNPKLEAGIELLKLVRTLPKIDEASFVDAFKLWSKEWHDFLQEKTIDPETGRWHWTHKRLRQARDSISAHPVSYTHLTLPTM